MRLAGRAALMACIPVLALTATAAGLPVDSVVPMTLAQAAKDIEQTRGCRLTVSIRPLDNCLFGDVSGNHSMVLIGDSNASHWLPALDRAAKRHGWRLYFFANAACPIAQVPVYQIRFKRIYVECDIWRDSLVEKLSEIGPIDVLVIGRTWQYQDLIRDSQGRTMSPVKLEAAWRSGMTGFLARLSVPRPRVAVIRSQPNPGLDYTVCLGKNLATPSICDQARVQVAHPDGLLARAESRIPNLTLVDPTDAFYSAHLLTSVAKRNDQVPEPNSHDSDLFE
ncbi:MAG: hypothetical protein F2826_00715 [Actinobacteria bacterium]|nr:hypothetical protein [Actinomycetota bacterium]